MATCKVTFSDNSVTQYGAAIYSSDNSEISFINYSNVSNVVSSNFEGSQIGGIIFSEKYGHVSFADNSVTTFINNSGDFGAAIFSFDASSVSFKGRSKVMFKYNNAHHCGILASAFCSSVNFIDDAKIIYNNNKVSGIYTE